LEAYCKDIEEKYIEEKGPDYRTGYDYEGGPLVPRFTLRSVYYPDDGPLGVWSECMLKGCEP